MPTATRSRRNSTQRPSKRSRTPSRRVAHLSFAQSKQLSTVLASPRAKLAFNQAINIRLERIAADEQRVIAETEFKAKLGERANFADEIAKCAKGAGDHNDPSGLFHWFENWCWTFDPRLIAENKVPYVRFIPWPKQREFLAFLHYKVCRGEPWLLEKSRDQGATYLVSAYCLWRWLFTPGFKATFCSRDELNVDSKGNPDSIFEKLRIIYRRMPTWMMPDGFNERKHDNIMQLTNPHSGAIITGETGDNPGRGGRSTMYVVDEAAFLSHPSRVEAATSGNTDCIGWTSTPNPESGGLSNFFARKRAAFASVPPNADGVGMTFRLHWRDDPRKTEDWALQKKATMADPSIWDAEFEISYTPASEGLAIPYPWVQSAVLLYKTFGSMVPRAKKGITGGDVGAGKAKSVCAHRFGPLVLALDRRQEGDTTDTAYWMLDCMTTAGTDDLNFDSPGVGQGVLSTLTKIDRSRYPKIKGNAFAINTGDTPSDRVWPDEVTSADKFGNLKAELWWLARDAFHRAHLHYCWLMSNLNGPLWKGERGIEQKWNEVLAIPDDANLQVQLCTPKWFRNEKGKIVIETKKQLAMRQIPSPDDADAFVLSFLEPDHRASGIVLDTQAAHQDNPFIVR